MEWWPSGLQSLPEAQASGAVTSALKVHKLPARGQGWPSVPCQAPLQPVDTGQAPTRGRWELFLLRDPGSVADTARG